MAHYLCFYHAIYLHKNNLKLDFLKIEFQCKTQFVENRVWGDQTLKKIKKLKKNKICMELEFHKKHHYRYLKRHYRPP